MSLRGRLFATYFLLLSITLIIIGGSLLVFFSARPEPPAATYQNLQTTSRLILRDISIESVETPLIPRLVQLAEQYQTRIVLLTHSRVVRFDSENTLTEGAEIALYRDQTYSVNLGRVQQAVSIIDGFFGGFKDPDSDEEWLMLALQAPLNVTLLICSTPSTRSLSDALSDWGTSLAGPLIQSGIIGLAVAFLLAAIMSREIAQPLSAVAQAAGEVARGNYDSMLPETGAPEIRSMAESFNTMTREVRSTQQAQRDFLANVSHDLKTPLTSIQGYSQAIIDGAVKTPATAAEVIYSEADRLTRMVNELTTLATLQAGQVALHLDRLDIVRLVQALVERIDVVAKKKNVGISVHAPPSLVITADGDRMSQVITNLLSNAVKFTPENGRIRVTVRPIDSGAEIAVADTGIGIPTGELARVFERFYQVDKARGPARGTGLGLAIAKEIVTAHGGKIRAESAGEGRGAAFIVWLPPAPPVQTAIP